MLEQSFEQLYLLFRANYYKRMVGKIGTRKGSLSATESFCVEIIYLMGEPTLSEFAQFLDISLPNATYKVNQLVEKGYVEKAPSPQDRRETRLVVTAKFLDYYGLHNEDNALLMKRVRENFTEREIAELEETISKIIGLMQAPEEEEE